MRALLLLLALFSFAGEDVVERMERVAEVDIPRVERRLEAQVQQLLELQPLYQDTDRFGEATRRRSELMRDIVPAQAEYGRLHGKWLYLKGTIQTDPHAGRQKGIESLLIRWTVMESSLKERERQTQELNDKVREDERLYTQAAAAHRRRTVRVRFLAFGIPVLLLLTVLPALLARRTIRAAAAPVRPLPAKPADDFLIGGNIRLGRVIGKGGMGVVYEGTDLTLDRKVAVKCMREEISDHPRALEQFFREARLVASLKHPCIVEIYSILKEQGRLYLVFEYVEGETLHHALQVNRKLTPEQALSVLKQAASALDHAHSKKVIHRDLKPSNIMLTPTGAAQVMDFGIAYQAKKTIATMTRAQAWGTPEFMAPEQELGEVGRETDIYALGVCFYAMLTGTLPFPGPDHLAQKRALRLPEAGLPAPLIPILRKALAVDPRQRFHSGEELVAAAEKA